MVQMSNSQNTCNRSASMNQHKPSSIKLGASERKIRYNLQYSHTEQETWYTPLSSRHFNEHSRGIGKMHKRMSVMTMNVDNAKKKSLMGYDFPLTLVPCRLCWQALKDDREDGDDPEEEYGNAGGEVHILCKALWEVPDI